MALQAVTMAAADAILPIEKESHEDDVNFDQVLVVKRERERLQGQLKKSFALHGDRAG